MNRTTRQGTRTRRMLIVCAALVIGLGGLLLWPRSRVPAGAATAATAAAAATTAKETNRAQLARLTALVSRLSNRPAEPAPERLLTSDERIRALAAGDPVGTLVPILAGLPKEKQLEMLKAMMSWPDNKLLFQIPELANATERPLTERAALAQELGEAIVGSLEDEGYHYDLPACFRAVGAPLAPPPPDQIPPQL